MLMNLAGWGRYNGSDHARLSDRFNLGLKHAFMAPPDPITDKAQLIGLFLLLDKSYSAGLRRTVRDWGDYASPTHMVIDRVFQNRTYRKQFEKFASFTDATLSRDSLDDIEGRVNGLAELMSLVNGSGRWPLSFSSKFLHFRSGFVPIWDDFARSGLRKVTGSTRYSVYADYARDFVEVLGHVYRKGAFQSVEVKRLDNYLIWRGGSAT